MKSSYRISVLLLLCLQTAINFAQEKKAGPVIGAYGKVWDIEEPEYKTELDKEFKAVFDVMASPESPTDVNPRIETVARYFNMHAQAGVSSENIKAALIVHNKASKDLMTNDAYKRKFGTDNPNADLLVSLMEAGVEVIFCGQSSLSRDIPMTEVLPGVKNSLSAMTALIQLQDEGYRLIKF